MAAFDNIQYIDSASINVLVATGSFSGNFSGSLFGTASNAVSASWAPSGANGTTLTTGSTYQITSSWANNSKSASFITDGSGQTITLTPASSSITLVDTAGDQILMKGGDIAIKVAGSQAMDINTGNVTFNKIIEAPAGIDMLGNSTISSVGIIETTISNITLRVNQGIGAGGAGDCGVNVANDSTSPSNSGASYNINVYSGSGALLSINSVQWAHVPQNRVTGLLPGWSYIVLNKDVTNVRGFGMCSPGISGYDLGNFSMFLCDIVNNVYRIPYWVPGVYQPTDVSLDFSVHGITNVPLAQNTYSSGSISLSVNSSNVSGSAGSAGGTINFASASLPAPSGIITRTSGTGDAFISYSLINTLTWRDSFSVQPKTGNISCYGNTTFYGQMTITSSNGQYNLLTNGNKIDGSQIYTGSVNLAANNFIALSPFGSVIGYDVSNGGGTGLGKHFGNGASIYDTTVEIAYFKNSSNFTDGIHNALILLGTPTILGWGTDGGGDIGLSGSFRPQNIWMKGNLSLQGAASSITASIIGSNTGTLNVIGTITASAFNGTASNAVNARTSSNGAFAWGSMWYNGSTMTNTSYNCNITRSSIGTFSVSFINSAASNQYAVIADGVSGSAGLPTITASLISPIFLRTNGFTMSVQKILAAATPPADFTSASFAVFSYF